MFLLPVRDFVIQAVCILNSTHHGGRLTFMYCFKKLSQYKDFLTRAFFFLVRAGSLSLDYLFVCLFCFAFYQLLLIVSYRHLFLVSTANANWQKMCHLGSPAHKNCVTLRAGMVASATRKQIFFNQVSILAYFCSNITAVRAEKTHYKERLACIS